jgi:hypothetical protein
MKPILFTFAFAATLAAQNFIQMSDPQFGMFTKDASFEHIARRTRRTREPPLLGSPTSARA